MSQPLLELNDLTTIFPIKRGQVTAVNSVSLTVEPCEILGMVKKSTQRDQIILEGTVSSPINPPHGCLFLTRGFAKKDPECEQEFPPEVMVDGYRIACWLYE
jgi:ABC-type dipeptide/oligopeptide/nickel transport system ATPase component